MTPEETERYARLGVMADVKEKAGALRQAMIEMGNAIGDSSGFTMVRFGGLIDSLRSKLEDFEAAVKAREALKEIPNGNGLHAKEGRILPSELDQPRLDVHPPRTS